MENEEKQIIRSAASTIAVWAIHNKDRTSELMKFTGAEDIGTLMLAMIEAGAQSMESLMDFDCHINENFSAYITLARESKIEDLRDEVETVMECCEHVEHCGWDEF